MLKQVHRLKFARFVLFLLGLVSASAPAAPVGSLNEATVRVTDKGDNAREQATRDALREVLIKISGDRHAIDAHPDLLAKAGDLVQQYQYRDAEATTPDSAPAPQLWVQFDDSAVRQRLGAAGVAIWQNDRPTLLVWQISGPANGEAVATANDSLPATLVLRQSARRRGLPLLLPQYDETDRQLLTYDDLKQVDVAKLRGASARYSAQEIATAIVTQDQNGNWRGRFTLLRGDKGQTSVAQGASVAEVVAQGVDQIADALVAPTVAMATSASEAVELAVEGLASLRQMAQVESYLRTVPGVSAVELLRLEPSQVIYRLTARGGKEALAQAIAGGSVLVASTSSGAFHLNPAVEAAPTPAPVSATPAPGAATGETAPASPADATPPAAGAATASH